MKLKVSYISKNKSDYINIFTTGIPTIFRQGLGAISAAILNKQAVRYGDSVVAAISIANKIYMLIRNIILGIGQGYQPIAGYCYGAGKKERVKRAFVLSSIAGTVICSIFAVIVLLSRTHVMTWFRADEDVIAIGSHALLFFCISMPFLAYSTYVNQTYQCLGYSIGATVLASCRQGIFFIPLAMFLPKVFGLTGIELLQPIADLMTFCISIPFQICFFRRHLCK